MPYFGAVVPFKDKEPRPDAVFDPSSAQLQLWLAQIRRDHGLVSDAEMARFELRLKPQARRSITIYNPHTGELRKVDRP